MVDSPSNDTRKLSVGTRQRLRHVTHRLHTRLSAQPLLYGLTRPDYPLSIYKLVLTANFHVYRSIESAIETCLAAPAFSAPFAYADRRTLPWLAEDLQHFGIDPDAAAHRPRQPPLLSVPGGPGQLIGTLYAIEGATLGGQVVSRQLQANLGLAATTGARFFHGYGDVAETGRRWQAFEQYADSVSDDALELRAAENAATAVFKMIEVQLDDYHARLIR